MSGTVLTIVDKNVKARQSISLRNSLRSCILTRGYSIAREVMGREGSFGLAVTDNESGIIGEVDQSGLFRSNARFDYIPRAKTRNGIGSERCHALGIKVDGKMLALLS